MAKKEAEPATTKRRVKNPETFRERALKTTDSNKTQSKTSVLFGSVGGSLRKLFSPVGRLLKKIFNRQPFRVIGKVIFPSYFRKSWKELKLVKWPDWPQSRRLTFAVLVFAVIFGVTVAAVDYVLDKLFQNILLN